MPLMFHAFSPAELARLLRAFSAAGHVPCADWWKV